MLSAISLRHVLVQTVLLGSLGWCSGARHSGASTHAGLQLPNLPSNNTKRPLIGILSQPGKPAPGNQSYIAASYIKFVEAAGARAVPILCDAPPQELERIFKAVNGLLIPGGGQNLSPGHPFYDASAALLQMTVAANDAGDFIPLHGTCLGFEALAIIVSRDADILSSYDSFDDASPLILTEDGQSESAFFGALPRELLQAVQEKPLAMENHGRGFSSCLSELKEVPDGVTLCVEGLGMKEYNGSKALQDFFKVVSLSVDKLDVAYISTLESRKYPVTATQWHPEKNAFEWPKHLAIPHSAQAVDLTYSVAKFLVEQARGNTHAPASPQEENGLLIYNYRTTFTGKENPSKAKSESDFDECYFFEPYSNTLGIVQPA